MPTVNPAILAWARETAGLSPAEAVDKLPLPAAHGMSGLERLEALEAGREAPTRAMISRMAERYRRPLVVFYMSVPPRRGDRGEDFRTLPESVSKSNEALLDALVRDLKTRQALVRAALEDEGEAVPLPFVASASSDDGVDRLVASLRATLGLSLEEFRAAANANTAFDLLRDHAENIGVYVILVGDLGSHHTALDTDTFRGFAIADPVCPFIAINDKDARAAWSFTLLHELTHVWLGQTGVSGGAPEKVVERFCNDVASEYLLPATELARHPWGNLHDIDIASLLIGNFARARNVSRQMVAYRLFRVGLIDGNAYRRLRDAFQQEWHEERLRRREEARESEGGPSFYVVRRHRVGKALLDLASRMIASGTLTTSKVGKILGVRATHVPALIRT